VSRERFSSGMLRDMDQGGSVYLRVPGWSPEERPPNVLTLDPAPCEECVTLDEQFPPVERPPAAIPSSRLGRLWRRARGR